jgi:hypothetical protein
MNTDNLALENPKCLGEVLQKYRELWQIIAKVYGRSKKYLMGVS